MTEELGTTETTTSTEPTSTENVDTGTEDSGQGGEIEGGEGTQAKQKADENHPANLGRKVKALSEQFEGLRPVLDELTEFIRTQRSSQSPANQPKGDIASNYDDGLFEQMCRVEPPPVETIVTAKDQWLVNKWEERAIGKLQGMAQVSYQRDYFKKLDDPELKEMGGDLHARVIQMVTDPKDKGERYNRKITGRALVDAEMNYLKALNDLRSGKGSGGDLSNFNKGNPEGSGPTIPSGGTKKNVAPVKLSKEAQEYADWLGMSADDRADAMTRKISGVRGSV